MVNNFLERRDERRNHQKVRESYANFTLQFLRQKDSLYEKSSKLEALEEETRGLIMRSPIVKGRISSFFGVRRKDSSIHKGIDIAAKKGTAILSPRNLKLIRFGQTKRAGNYAVFSDVDKDIVHKFCHLNRSITYPTGTTFLKGDSIAEVGNTGHSTGPHLHWEVWIRKRPVDPKQFIAVKKEEELL